MERELPGAGLPVFSTDGAHLGHVAEVAADAGWFKVNVPQAPDYWLPLSAVVDGGPRYVLLKIRKSELKDVRFEGPKPELPGISALGTDRDFSHATRFDFQRAGAGGGGGAS